MRREIGEKREVGALSGEMKGTGKVFRKSWMKRSGPSSGIPKKHVTNLQYI